MNDLDICMTISGFLFSYSLIPQLVKIFKKPEIALDISWIYCICNIVALGLSIYVCAMLQYKLTMIFSIVQLSMWLVIFGIKTEVMTYDDYM